MAGKETHMILQANVKMLHFHSYSAEKLADDKSVCTLQLKDPAYTVSTIDFSENGYVDLLVCYELKNSVRTEIYFGETSQSGTNCPFNTNNVKKIDGKCSLIMFEDRPTLL